MPLNVELLRKVQAHILEEPLRFDMGHYVGGPRTQIAAPKCGTTACIAGWACLLGKDMSPKELLEEDSIDITARQLLGLKETSFLHPLFYHSKWPKPFQTQYEDGLIRLFALLDETTTTRRQFRTAHKKLAQIAVARIDYYIEHQV